MQKNNLKVTENFYRIELKDGAGWGIAQLNCLVEKKHEILSSVTSTEGEGRMLGELQTASSLLSVGIASSSGIGTPKAQHMCMTTV